MRIAIACGLVFGAVALLPPAATAQFAEKKVLTLEIARKIVTTAESEAARNHLAGVVAVGLTREEEYVRWYERIAGRPRARVPTMLEVYEYLPRLGPVPISVIQSTHDNYLPAAQARTLFGPDTDRRQLHPIESRNHSFTDARRELYDEIRASIAWVDHKRNSSIGAE